MEALLYHIEIFAQKWFSFMVASSIQLGLFIIFILVIAALFKNQSARFLYLIWLIGLVKILVPPTIKLPTFVSNSRFVMNNNIPTLFIPEIRISMTNVPVLSYQGYLFLIWMLIATILVMFWFYKALQFRRNVMYSCREITRKVIFDSEIIIRHKIKIFTGPNITMPFTRGLFSPKIYLPEFALSWPENELSALIFHELAHIKRKDIFIISLQNIIQLLYFFHPLVWVANMQISRYREKACDDFAIKSMQGKSLEYGKLLLKSIDNVVGWKSIPSLSTYFHQSKKFLLNRFEYILNRRENIMTKLNLIQKLVLIGIIILAIASSCHKDRIIEQPLQPFEKNGSTFEYSIKSLQAGLVDSQKVDYDTPPMPAGGFEAFQEYLNFPEFAKRAGSVFNVKINEKGEITAVHLKGSPHRLKGLTGDQIQAVAYCEGKLTEALSHSKWTPAMKHGRPIAAWITLPIQYKRTIVTEKITTRSEVPPPPPPSEAQSFFVAYDEPPEPIGGFAAIQKNLFYPEIARRAEIEGTVTVQVKIDENGEVIDTKILKSFGNNGCDEAAVEAIKKVKWNPAKQKGNPVVVWVSLPVRFRLRNETDIMEEKTTEDSKHLPPSPPSEGADEFFVAYDEPPQPIGGFAAIQKNLVYPELSRKAGIEGTVIVQAKIDENGDVVDTKILVPLGESGCNEAAVAAIKSVKWKPALVKGQPVAVLISVPVRFKLK